jgi:hypothetical protein
MCLDLSCAHSQGSSTGSGFGAAMVTAGLLVTAALTYQAMVVAWPVLLVAEIVGLCLVYRKSPVVRALIVVAGAVLAGTMWITRWAYRRCRKPSTEVVAGGLAYQATLYVERPRGEDNIVIAQGVVEGPNAKEVAATVRQRYLERFQKPTEGPLKVHVQPVTS